MRNEKIITELNECEELFSEYIHKTLKSFQSDHIFNGDEAVRSIGATSLLEPIQQILDIEVTKNVQAAVDELNKNVADYDYRITSDDTGTSEEQWAELFYFDKLWTLDLLINSQKRAGVTIKQITDELSARPEISLSDYENIHGFIERIKTRIVRLK